MMPYVNAEEHPSHLMDTVRRVPPRRQRSILQNNDFYTLALVELTGVGHHRRLGGYGIGGQWQQRAGHPLMWNSRGTFGAWRWKPPSGHSCPATFPVRPRKAPITSRNFAAMSPFHNYPTGRAAGNHWGDALSLFVTSARSPYFFFAARSDPKDPDGGTAKTPANTLICGPTGSGKTVFIGFLIAMLDRRGVTQVIFDKDRGLEILVRALGGEYLPLRSGVATGFNPLQLPVTPANVEIPQGMAADSDRGAVAIAPYRFRTRDGRFGSGAARYPGSGAEARRLSRLVEFLDPTDPEGVHARLARWCDVCRGDYAWVFDNSRDTVVSRLSGRSVVGFDVTEFLEHPLTRSPITLYLFHLVRQLLDGRRLVCWMDEFWRLLADPAFESFAKTARRPGESSTE